MRSVKISSLAPGLNNRLEPTQLVTVLDDRSRGTFLYAADNVDINSKGYLARRRGTSKRIEDSAHSIWADSKGAFAVVAGNLVALQLSGDQLEQTPIRTGLPNRPLSYSRGADGDLYWSNGQSIRRVAAGEDRPIATLPPNAPDSFDIVANSGGLAAGRYLLAFTEISVDGESPATPVVQVDVPDNGSIAFTGLRHVYMSGPNGDILTYQGFGDRVLVHTQDGRRCETINLALMPAGSVVRHYRGRMLVADDSVLYVSEPFNYGLYNPATSYFPFPERISVIEPVDNGLYICADKTYWIGDLFNDTLQELLPYGALPGTSGQSPDLEQVFWQSPRGLVVADKNQAVKNLQDDALVLPPAASGASLYREQNGSLHIVSTRFAVEPSVAAATSFMDAEIVRKGTIL
ncbi:MAG: hypothetical protein REI11_20025 [Patulibacter sp.]|nr:hypothetical protein [Patulibacter sp.]